MKYVFIGGAGRSGTTMLGSMLGNSSNTFTTPESMFKEVIFNEKNSIEILPEKLKKNFRLKLWQLDNLNLENISTREDVLDRILKTYKKQRNIEDDKRIWIDHTPANFMIFNTLNSLFPNAKFIHIIRDSRGVASSVMPLEWGPSQPFDFGDWWLSKLSLGFSAELAKPQQVINVKYEDIVSNTEVTLKKLCHFLEIPFEKTMLKGDKSFLPEYTHKQHQLVGAKVNTGSIDKWKKKLTLREIEIIESITGTILKNLGYELSGNVKANVKISTVEKIQYFFNKWIIRKLLKRQTQQNRQLKALKKL